MGPVEDRNTTRLLPAHAGRRQMGLHWFEARDGDPDLLELFNRHYSARAYKDGRIPKLFVGPGEKLVLMTADATALFVWRKFISGDGQQSINCSVFRNEGPTVSSLLILDAEAVARKRWPDQRFYTYVNPRRVISKNPGFCFKMAGWTRCGITKWNKLLIFEKMP